MILGSLLTFAYFPTRLCVAQTATPTSGSCDGCYLGQLVNVAPAPAYEGPFIEASPGTSVIVTAYAVTSSTTSLGSCVTETGPQILLSPHFNYSTSYIADSAAVQSSVASSFVAYVALPGCSVYPTFYLDPPLPSTNNARSYGSASAVIIIGLFLPSGLLLWLGYLERRRTREKNRKAMMMTDEQEVKEDTRPYIQQKAELEAEQARYEMGHEEREYQLRWQRAELEAQRDGYELEAEHREQELEAEGGGHELDAPDRIFEMEADHATHELPPQQSDLIDLHPRTPNTKDRTRSQDRQAYRENRDVVDESFKIPRKPLNHTQPGKHTAGSNP